MPISEMGLLSGLIKKFWTEVFPHVSNDSTRILGLTRILANSRSHNKRLNLLRYQNMHNSYTFQVDSSTRERRKDTFANHHTWYQQLAVSDMDHMPALLVYLEIHVQHTVTSHRILLQNFTCTHNKNTK